MMMPYRRIVQESERVAVQFLIAELNVALTFLDVAETTGVDDTRTRNQQHAQTAYLTVQRHLPRVTPTQEELLALHGKLAILKGRLHELGYSVDPETKLPS